MLTAPRHYGRQTGLVYNSKGALCVWVTTSDTNHGPASPFHHASLLPKPMPIMSNHTLKRKLYAIQFFFAVVPPFHLPPPATVIPQQVNLRSPKRTRRTNLLLRSRWMWVIERRSTGVRSVSGASTR